MNPSAQPVQSQPVANPSLSPLRQSLALVLAVAVQQLFAARGSKVHFGPLQVGDHGFQADFDLPEPLGEEDLPELQQRMQALLAAPLLFQQLEVSREEAAVLLKDQPYQLKLLASQAGTQVQLWQLADVMVLLPEACLASIHDQQLAFVLQQVSGAYWQGDASQPMLQRVSALAFDSKAALEQHLWGLQEARKRDHRKLGQQLELFMVSEQVGPGLVLWQPRGAMVRLLIEEFSRKAHLMHGYDWVISPHIGRASLWHTSGHLDFYKEGMYAPMDIDGEAYHAKPMNCPFHIEIYQHRKRSYRELPIRYAEFGTVYRYELSGALHGLTRVRGFTQDDAHIFCTPDQVHGEIRAALDFSLMVLRSFGLSDFRAYLSTRPTDAVGDPADWEVAQHSLQKALEESGLPFEIDEGGGAFYGPKIDLKVQDALGRSWQLSTIQFDFNLPGRFGLEYIAEDGQAHRPFMVHRALFGSMERFFGVLLEHHAGDFPLWLAPVQVQVVPIADRHLQPARQLVQALKARQFRAELDDRPERMQAKIRDAELHKIPLVVVIGDQEVQSGRYSVRERGVQGQHQLSLQDLQDRLQQASVDRLLQDALQGQLS